MFCKQTPTKAKEVDVLKPSKQQNKRKEDLQVSLMMQVYTSYSNGATNIK